MFSLRGERCDPFMLEVLINGVRIDMEVDTGASASIISEDTYREIAAHSAMEPLQESTLKLTTYNYQYTKGTLQVQQASFWCIVCTRNFPTDYGNAPEGNQRGCRLHR